jgi:acyl-CoA thioesterase FadM
MLTLGHMAACGVAWGGDPAAVARISAQYRAPVSMGDEITAAGRIKEIDYVTDTVVLEMWVTLERDGQTEHPIKKGEVTVSLG